MITINDIKDGMPALSGQSDRIVELTWLIGELEMMDRRSGSDNTLLRKAKKELRAMDVKIGKEF